MRKARKTAPTATRKPAAVPAGHARGGPGEGLWPRFQRLLAQPVSGASLAVFRICLGLVMALEAWDLWRPNPAAISTGRSPVETYYAGADITFHFPFAGFEWLPLLPPPFIRGLVLMLAVGGVLMALGLFYRVAAALVFASWGYLWLVESTRTYWQSHYYLEFLACLLMLWLPAARRYSVDAWRARRRPGPATIPFWPVLLLRGQLVIAYFYAGVAKLNADWLLDAVPVRWFLGRPEVTQPFAAWLPGAWFAAFERLVRSVEFAYVISYAGLIFDLAIGFLLLVPRFRLPALGLMALFHATNHLLIFDDIGWFPLLGITTALIFLAPDWPERLAARLNWRRAPAPAAPVAAPPAVPHRLARWTAPCVCAWLGVQAVMPARHFLIPGDARFTYEGLSFSWRLKTETHHAHRVQLFLEDPAILARGADGRPHIHWTAWRGDPVLHRRVEPGRIPWAGLPEIVTVLDPLVGERLLFNPVPSGARAPEAARRRLDTLWQALHGRAPAGVEATRGFPEVLQAMSAALAAAGRAEEAAAYAALAAQVARLERGELPPAEAARTVTAVGTRLRDVPGRAGLMRELRRLHPFALEGEPPPSAPFLVVDDPALFEPVPAGEPARVRQAAWVSGPGTRPRGPVARVDNGAEPRLVFFGDLGPAERHLLPQAYLLDWLHRPGQPPRIAWNSLRDLNESKLLHISNQAFYLRRYARRVAALWTASHGRRPAVHAVTAMSLNGRPHQELVDPRADLASVPYTWYWRDPWVRDLRAPRIPREALKTGLEHVGR